MSSAVASDLNAPYRRVAEDLKGNPEQWKTYESKGHCVLLAGPGSGKTKTLTVKMARMLAEDISAPRGIACITYNSECVGELKRRLERIGITGSRNVFLGTVHSFCLKHVIVPYAPLTGLSLAARLKVALPSEQGNFFEEAFAEVYGGTPPSDWPTAFDKYDAHT